MGGAGGDDEEAIVGPLPDAALAQDPPEPFVVTSPVESEEEPPEGEVPALYDSAVDASAWSVSAPVPTPTDLPARPVPTEVPSPTSLGAAQEAETMVEDIMTLPTHTLVEPKAYSSMVGMSSSAATQSPSELPVPTERPSPTELSARRPTPKPPAVAVESGMLGSSALNTSAPASGQQRSPTEMPVPTAVPSPTMPCEDEGETVTAPPGAIAKTSSIEKTLTHSRPATSVVQSSPVDLPVPTARPSPTSMNEGEDEEEAIVGPLPDAAMKPPEPHTFGIAMGAGDAEVPAPHESALADSAWSESAPERTPTELPEDMPVPTDVPSPTSLRSEDEADTILEQVGTLPTQTLVPPPFEARAAEDEAAETNVPGVPQASAAAGSSVFMSDSMLAVDTSAPGLHSKFTGMGAPVGFMGSLQTLSSKTGMLSATGASVFFRQLEKRWLVLAPVKKHVSLRTAPLFTVASNTHRSAALPDGDARANSCAVTDHALHG
ncbi:unnamed protein product [Symbiodinium natans]|uniref:Uncharacterized protein n=1 Tax=Symbiodinium natans TaxID=878477 RepID=A0A812SDK2_9DINO|nr:unnamed protein product [Symbiodinium natans]